MASENQGMQAALIILVILVILLSVATFMFFTSSRDFQNKYNVEQKNATEKNGLLTKAQDDINRLMAMIGVPVTGTDDLPKAESAFSDDMKAHAATVPDDKKFYRTALEQLATELSAKSAEVTKLQTDISTEQAKNQAFEAASKKQVDEAVAAKDAALAELNAEKGKFMQAQTQAEEEKRRALELVEKTQQEKTTELEKVNKDLEVAKNEVVSLKKELAKGIETLAGMQPENPAAIDDGEIRQVDRRRNAVWVNRGAADGLRPGVTFSVHAPDAKPGDEKAVKGKVEVVSVTGDHLAECRISEDSIKDPILPGDKIYTHLWDAGRGVRVAIVGRVDLDGDGSDDRQRLVNMVLASGGKIDASVDDEGKEDGQLQFGTRYLIVGDTPSQKAQTAYNRFLEQAKTLGVQAIGADRFLEEIGYKPSTRVVRYGPGGNAETVQLDRDGGVPSNSQAPTNAFRQRRPPGVRPGSAY